MGIKGNDEIFDDGLIYEGVWDEPKKFRGQTGSQDNIIPMEDIFTGVTNFYPDNQLTKYILYLRTYRPKCIQNFFIDLKNTIDSLSGGSIFHYLKNEKNSKGNLVYKLDSMSELNGVSHKEKHTGIGDCEATLGIAQIIKKKAHF